MASPPEGAWYPDVLGAPYQARTLPLEADEEGPVAATLVRRAGEHGRTGRAVLHVHGFADYFFHTALADFWCHRGYDFYALDLRKYGRSLGSHQSPNHVTDLSTYYKELDLAHDLVAADHDQILVSAHSTGGLTVPLWVHDRAPRVAALVLNAPWLAMHGDLLTRTVSMPVLAAIGAGRPDLEIPRKVSGLYGRSLHRRHEGEWEFDLTWKPLDSWPVRAGWIRAIVTAQGRVAAGLDLPQPILGLTSARSSSPQDITDPDVHSTDIVLDVQRIRARLPELGRHVTSVRFEGAVHDVTLSALPVRTRVFGEIASFLSAYVES